MIFRHFLSSANESNAFVVACEHSREALLVDAGDYDPAIVEFLTSQCLRLKTIFVTHDHFDHTGGLDGFMAYSGAEVVSGKAAIGKHKTRRVAHGDLVRVGDLTGTVLVTSGHTLDSISLAFPEMAFTGDALFSGSIGGTSSTAHAREEIEHIRKHIFTLADTTEIHPGHGPSSTVGIERRHNPFFL